MYWFVAFYVSEYKNLTTFYRIIDSCGPPSSFATFFRRSVTRVPALVFPEMFILVNYIILCLSSWSVLSSLYYFYVDNLGRFRFYTFRHCYIPTLRFPFVGRFGRLADSFSPWKDFRTWNSPIKPTRYFSRSWGNARSVQSYNIIDGESAQ